MVCLWCVCSGVLHPLGPPPRASRGPFSPLSPPRVQVPHAPGGGGGVGGGGGLVVWEGGVLGGGGGMHIHADTRPCITDTDRHAGLS